VPHGVPTVAGGMRRAANRRGRAAQRQADQGSLLFERSEFSETPPAASSAGQSPQATRDV